MLRLGVVLLVFLSAPVRAQSGEDALQWLQKIAAAADKLNYSGVVVYRSGGQSETSRVVHAVENGREIEHVEVLDGSPREVLLENDEVRCVLPDSRLIVIERRTRQRPFPALPLENLGNLTDVYLVRKGTPTRIAGIDSQSLRIDPKDEFRYGRQLWFDVNSGLLLKAVLYDEKGEARETFSFSEVRIGLVDHEALKMHSNTQSSEWRVHTVRAQATKADDEPWTVRTAPPGFRLVSSMKRQTRPDAPAVTHLMYSDGLTTISIFVQPLVHGATASAGGSSLLGAVGIYRRAIGGHQLLVMGDAPMQTLKRIGDAVEARQR